MDKKQLIDALNTYKIPCSSEQLNMLFSFMKYTLSENEKFNLTAITDEPSFIEKMIFDSAMALHGISVEGKKVIDVGTGAGYPGMVIRILSPKADVSLLDSTAKKITHLENFASKNSLDITGLAVRAEDFSRNNKEVFDYAFARAVAPLPILLEVIVPMLKVNGYFVALKGAGYEDELKDSISALKKLNCVIEDKFIFNLPESGDGRAIIRIKKIKPTHKKFPRQYTDIKRQPL